MKLQLERNAGLNTFTAYGTGYVSVNGIRHTCNLAVLPDRLIPDWTDATFETLSVGDIELLASLDVAWRADRTAREAAREEASRLGPPAR